MRRHDSSTFDRPGKDFLFYFNLYEFHLRRERALGHEEPSPFLVSLQSFILLDAAQGFILGGQQYVDAEELYSRLMKNKKQVQKLCRKIKKTNSQPRRRTWYAIVQRLVAESKELADQLETMADDG